MNGSGDRVTELDFRIANAVPADDRAIGLNHFAQAAGENALENRGVGVIGKTDHGERRKRPAAHGIDIAKRVGGRNLAEGVWIIDDRGEKVDRVDERQLGRELIHAGVVGFIEANQHVRIILPG